MFQRAILTAVFLTNVVQADITVTVDRLRGEQATQPAVFPIAPLPALDDLAAGATLTVIDGRAEGNDGLKSLHDGKLPENSDQPGANFFFASGTVGGRLRIDLGAAKDIGQINTYSWHNGDRSPQVYTMYAAEGDSGDFDAEPKLFIDPQHAGWTKLCDVDTRETKAKDKGGMLAVSLNDNDWGTIGRYRYLLLDIKRTEGKDPYGNTFFSEIDVVAPNNVARLKPNVPVVDPNERWQIVIDPTDLSPEMLAWANEHMKPVCREWYPKIVQMLPSEGFHPARTFTIEFRSDMGGTPAMAGGTRVSCNLPWFEKNQQGEGIGAVVHEMVHVVQQYRFGGKGAPFWLQEGIPDYIRWYLYEPQVHGARVRDIEKAKYDAAYRTSANFLNYVFTTYGTDILPKVNAAIRQGEYTDDIWPRLCKGKDLKQLEAEWKESLKTKNE